MSDQAKMFLVMLLAALMVIASGAAFYLGGENEADEPSLPEDTYIMLTYEVEGMSNGTPVNGSFGVQMLTGETGTGIMYAWPFNVTGNLGPLAVMPGSVFGSESFLARSSMGTPWGEKQGLMFIGHNFVGNDSMDIYFAHKGAHTDLVYRVEVISPGTMATYTLADVNITGMEALDLNPREDVSDLMRTRHVDEKCSYNLGGGGAWGLLEPRGSSSYRISMNATNYTFIAFGEQDILSMAAGGNFSYNEDWSLIGNGSKEFVLSGQVMFYYIEPVTAFDSEALFEVTVV